MTSPTIFWFRRDLRLQDNPGLTAALARGGPVIPVFILDPETEALGAAPKWRLGAGLEVFAQSLAQAGSRLILRRGPASDVLKTLVAETGAEAVHWSRAYDPASIARDTAVKSSLKDLGVEAVSHAGHVMFEPWKVETGQGNFYKVYTPFWKAVRSRDPGEPLPVPSDLQAPEQWPASDVLEDWALGAAMRGGAAVVARHARVGEAQAADRLGAFIEDRVAEYSNDRDRLDRDGTSGLSENLALGEISPRQCWAAGMAAHARGSAGAETFVKEVVWRE
ncbi:MAG: deoxyribodipyrimidine photo-lyase, partial [Pseudomonadota bacterium]